jgi:hypothetical protein
MTSVAGSTESVVGSSDPIHAPSGLVNGASFGIVGVNASADAVNDGAAPSLTMPSASNDGAVAFTTVLRGLKAGPSGRKERLGDGGERLRGAHHGYSGPHDAA